jgi:hypothetical protein
MTMHLTSTVHLKLGARRDIGLHERRDHHSEAGATDCEPAPADSRIWYLGRQSKKNLG